MKSPALRHERCRFMCLCVYLCAYFGGQSLERRQTIALDDKNNKQRCLTMLQSDDGTSSVTPLFTRVSCCICTTDRRSGLNASMKCNCRQN